jgi:hypothetical protein
MQCDVFADPFDPSIKRCKRWRCDQQPMVTTSPPEKCYLGPCRSPLVGVGNVLALVFDLATFGQAKRLADVWARRVLRRPSCGCTQRRGALNDTGERWLATLLGWWRSLQEALNALGRKITG